MKKKKFDIRSANLAFDVVRVEKYLEEPVEDGLVMCFSWCETKEGYGYWSAVNDDYYSKKKARKRLKKMVKLWKESGPEVEQKKPIKSKTMFYPTGSVDNCEVSAGPLPLAPVSPNWGEKPQNIKTQISGLVKTQTASLAAELFTPEWESVNEEFKDQVLKLFKTDTPMTKSQAVIAHATVGIATEAGELLDALKKHWVYGQPLDYVNVQEEAGDLLFYLQALLNHVGLTMEDCKQANIVKLKKRYPDGYTDQAAKERRDKIGESLEIGEGYRKLVPGEYIREGDQFIELGDVHWQDSIRVGSEVPSGRFIIYRRKI